MALGPRGGTLTIVSDRMLVRPLDTEKVTPVPVYWPVLVSASAGVTSASAKRTIRAPHETFFASFMASLLFFRVTPGQSRCCLRSWDRQGWLHPTACPRSRHGPCP